MTDIVRGAFEADYDKRYGSGVDAFKIIDDSIYGLGYANPWVEVAWLAWQAAARHYAHPTKPRKPMSDKNVCEVCGANPRLDPDVALFRANEKGVAPIWRCSEHRELPGTLELALAVKAGKWPHTMDARVWADKFRKTFPNAAWITRPEGLPLAYPDEGDLIGWFANAIMAGYDQAMLRALPPGHWAAPDEATEEMIMATHGVVVDWDSSYLEMTKAEWRALRAHYLGQTKPETT